MISPGFTVIVLPVLLVAFLIFLRVFGLARPFRPAQFCARSAKSGTWASRCSEALMLTCVGGLVFLFTATNRSTGGYLFTLDQLNPAFAAVNLQLALGAGAGLLLSVLLCLFWRNFAGVLVVSVVLVVYATFLNGPDELLERLGGADAMERQVSWTIQLGACDVDDAELWVNGVHLGSLPYTTTPDEFKAKVPFWAEPPDEMTNDEDRLKTPHYSPRGTSGFDSSWGQWAKIVMPGDSAKHWDRDGEDSQEAEASRSYYARIRFGDEWGYSRGKSGGGGGGRYIYHTNTTISSVRFPQRERRLEMLLDRARLANYRPPDDWFDAIESFGEDAVIAMRRLSATEIQMEEILAQWAYRRYQLGQVADQASAWRTFETICAEADNQGFYSTVSIAGKAVELLCPRLNPETLAKRAIKIIRSVNSYGWNHWYLGGKPHFGYADRARGLRTGARRTTGAWRGGGPDSLPMHAYVVAHAVWKMDEYLDTQDPQLENVIERKVVPAFLAENYDDINLVMLTNAIGSEALDCYLLRRDWRADAKRIPWDHQFHVQGSEVNGWLYLLSILDSPGGESFRQEHAHRIREMADGVTARVDAVEELAFLFVDLDKGEKSLACQYWPRFKTLSRRRKRDAIVMQYEYLLRMEPVSTADMYVEAFSELPGDYSRVSGAFKGLKALPDSKRELVTLALRRAVEEDSSHVTGWSGSDPHGARDFLLRDLNAVVSKRMLAERVLKDLHLAMPNAKPEGVKDWLANAEPGHPLMPMLGQDADPALRVLVLDAIKTHPTPANREILQTLLKDDDEQVRGQAEDTGAALSALAELPLASLCSMPNE
jgi:hypothetical protein